MDDKKQNKQQKALERFTDAVEKAYHSPGKIFWRGFLFGLGRGIGSLISWLILIAIIIWILEITGVTDALGDIFKAFESALEKLNSLRGF